MPDLQSAFYFSGVTYTTTGYGDLVLPREWRLVGAVEALLADARVTGELELQRAAVEPVRVFPQPTTTAALTQTPSPYTPPAPVIKAEPVKEAKEVPAGAVLCGMAGLVLSIDVKVGDSIAEGAPVAMLEAMKMKTNISSPQTGKIKSIKVKVSDKVEAGTVMLTFE